MGSENKAWTKGGCAVLVFNGWSNKPCQNRAKRDGYCGVHHPDAQARRDAKRRERDLARNAKWDKQAQQIDRARACVNALAGIENPAAWREAVERLVEAVLSLPSPSTEEHTAMDDVIAARFAVLALQEPPDAD